MAKQALPLAVKKRHANLATMTATDAPVLQTVENGVVTLTLNRPQVRNALDLAMLEALEAALLDLHKNPQCRVVVIRGAGDTFMAGGDIKHFAGVLQSGQLPSQLFSLMLSRVNLIVQLMRTLPQPVMAVVQGACAGFGVSLALACDLVLASDNAKFTLAYDRLGLTPDGGSSWQLVHTLGLKRATELVLLGDIIDASTAQNWGMVNRVMPEAELNDTAAQIAARLMTGAAATQARAKNLLNFASELSLAAQLDAEAEHFAHLANSPNFAEGVAAFMAKRTPNFKEN